MKHHESEHGMEDTSVTQPIPDLVITGAVGVGKTRVAFEISELLESRGMAHAFIDADLIYVFPDPLA